MNGESMIRYEASYQYIYYGYLIISIPDIGESNMNTPIEDVPTDITFHEEGIWKMRMATNAIYEVDVPKDLHGDVELISVASHYIVVVISTPTDKVAYKIETSEPEWRGFEFDTKTIIASGLKSTTLKFDPSGIMGNLLISFYLQNGGVAVFTDNLVNSKLTCNPVITELPYEQFGSNILIMRTPLGRTYGVFEPGVSSISIVEIPSRAIPGNIKLLDDPEIRMAMKTDSENDAIHASMTVGEGQGDIFMQKRNLNDGDNDEIMYLDTYNSAVSKLHTGEVIVKIGDRKVQHLHQVVHQQFN